MTFRLSYAGHEHEAAEKQSGVMLRLICHIGRLPRSDPQNLVPDDRQFGCSHLAHLVGDQRKLRL